MKKYHRTMKIIHIRQFKRSIYFVNFKSYICYAFYLFIFYSGKQSRVFWCKIIHFRAYKNNKFRSTCIEMLSMTQIHPWINHTWIKMACIQFIKNSKDSTWIIHVHSIGQIFKIPGNPTLDKSTNIHFHTLNSFSTKTHVKIKTK